MGSCQSASGAAAAQAPAKGAPAAAPADKGLEEIAVVVEEDFARAVSATEVKEVAVPVRNREPRTSKSDAMAPSAALEALKRGNARFSEGKIPIVRQPLADEQKANFVANGQKPRAAILGCADSRVPIDTIFDALPGDLFILRNAGNTCTNAEGSMVGSMEYAISHLDTKLILVLGHSNCGALAGATATMLAQKKAEQEGASTEGGKKKKSALEILLGGLVPVAAEAAKEMPQDATDKEIAVRAIRVNVFHTMANLLQYSAVLRRMVKSGEVEVHGGIYDLSTSKVEFMGQHPKQVSLVDGREDAPPSSLGA